MKQDNINTILNSTDQYNLVQQIPSIKKILETLLLNETQVGIINDCLDTWFTQLDEHAQKSDRTRAFVILGLQQLMIDDLTTQRLGEFLGKAPADLTEVATILADLAKFTMKDQMLIQQFFQNTGELNQETMQSATQLAQAIVKHAHTTHTAKLEAAESSHLIETLSNEINNQQTENLDWRQKPEVEEEPNPMLSMLADNFASTSRQIVSQSDRLASTILKQYPLKHVSEKVQQSYQELFKAFVAFTKFAHSTRAKCLSDNLLLRAQEQHSALFNCIIFGDFQVTLFNSIDALRYAQAQQIALSDTAVEEKLAQIGLHNPKYPQLFLEMRLEAKTQLNQFINNLETLNNLIALEGDTLQQIKRNMLIYLGKLSYEASKKQLCEQVGPVQMQSLGLSADTLADTLLRQTLGLTLKVNTDAYYIQIALAGLQAGITANAAIQQTDPNYPWNKEVKAGEPLDCDALGKLVYTKQQYKQATQQAPQAQQINSLDSRTSISPSMRYMIGEMGNPAEKAFLLHPKKTILSFALVGLTLTVVITACLGLATPFGGILSLLNATDAFNKTAAFWLGLGSSAAAGAAVGTGIGYAGKRYQQHKFFKEISGDDDDATGLLDDNNITFIPLARGNN